MNRILFVDDEPRVLEGLRRMLHFAGQAWDVEFVDSGPEALHRAAQRPLTPSSPTCACPAWTARSSWSTSDGVFPRPCGWSFPGNVIARRQ